MKREIDSKLLIILLSAILFIFIGLAIFGINSVGMVIGGSGFNVYPSGVQKEVCTDGIDNEGDGAIDCADPDCLLDEDGDGYYNLLCGNDCNDADASVHPGVGEICSDNIDNDCSQKIDCSDPVCEGKSAVVDGFGISSLSKLCCSGSLVDTFNDANNCGLCGISCGSGQICIYGSCISASNSESEESNLGNNPIGETQFSALVESVSVDKSEEFLQKRVPRWIQNAYSYYEGKPNGFYIKMNVDNPSREINSKSKVYMFSLGRKF
ncbi:hypothetical protein COU54_03565 [Candidatus Pacearchaeota archaeon CG10_big_fil_rev_8_21_14_0_10_31_24]|nr:MAG: hypothetical protein COU54_03565 [Candidatus Pacearchaeota archaeon CG10_big_fil_rev_8_21_14_0_10_31_24]